MNFSGVTTNNYRLYKQGPRLPPLRTFAEMAEEFGVTTRKLSALCICYHGPKTVRLGSSENKKAWCDPQEMRTWWKSLKEKT